MAVFNSKDKRITRWRNSRCLICYQYSSNSYNGCSTLNGIQYCFK